MAPVESVARRGEPIEDDAGGLGGSQSISTTIGQKPSKVDDFYAKQMELAAKRGSGQKSDEPDNEDGSSKDDHQNNPSYEHDDENEGVEWIEVGTKGLFGLIEITKAILAFIYYLKKRDPKNKGKTNYERDEKLFDLLIDKVTKINGYYMSFDAIFPGIFWEVEHQEDWSYKPNKKVEHMEMDDDDGLCLLMFIIYIAMSPWVSNNEKVLHLTTKEMIHRFFHLKLKDKGYYFRRTQVLYSLLLTDGCDPNSNMKEIYEFFRIRYHGRYFAGQVVPLKGKDWSLTKLQAWQVISVLHLAHVIMSSFYIVARHTLTEGPMKEILMYFYNGTDGNIAVNQKDGACLFKLFNYTGFLQLLMLKSSVKFTPTTDDHISSFRTLQAKSKEQGSNPVLNKDRSTVQKNSQRFLHLEKVIRFMCSRDPELKRFCDANQSVVDLSGSPNPSASKKRKMSD